MVIPLLVQNAVVPAVDHLPDSLRAIASRQAFELSDRRWRSDVQALIDELDRLQQDKVDQLRRHRSTQEMSWSGRPAPPAPSAQRPGPPPDQSATAPGRPPLPTSPDGRVRAADTRPVRGAVPTGVGAFLTLLGLVLVLVLDINAGLPLVFLGQFVLVPCIVVFAVSRSRRAVEASRGAADAGPERWHGGLAGASLGLTVLAVTGMALLKGPAITPFATTTGSILLLLVGTAGFLSRGWTIFDELHVWRRIVVALIAALVVPAVCFAAVWIVGVH